MIIDHRTATTHARRWQTLPHHEMSDLGRRSVQPACGL